MSCNCTEKNQPAGSCGGVIINNIHSEFQSIIIPTSLGDSTTGKYIPKVGAYKNAIVSYRADDKSYIYDDKGHFTLLSNAAATATSVDDALDINSENPVRNSVITEYINDIRTRLATTEENVTINTNDITDIDERLTTAEDDIDTNIDDISDLDDRMDSAEDDISSLTDRMGTAEENIATNTQGIIDVNERVDHIAGGGEENVIEVVQQNGTDLPVVDKTVNVVVPTNTSDLNNDSDFITQQDANTLVTGAVHSAVVTIEDADSAPIGAFGVNQAANSTITVPSASSSAFGLVKLVASTTDIGEGATLAAGTIYGVYQ